MKNSRNPILFTGLILICAFGGIALGAESESGSGARIEAPGEDPGLLSWWLRRIIVAASGIIYWGGVLIQARRIRRKIGRTPNLRPRGTKEVLLWLGWSLVILGWIAQPLLLSGPADTWLERWPFLSHPIIFAGGTALVLLGYAATLWCYAAMGTAWRIGIDQSGSSELIESGPYRSMRHPIYSFQIVMLLGAALLLPTPVSLGLLTLHFVCASIKAKDEERHLVGIFGETYLAYRTRTGKFVPGL